MEIVIALIVLAVIVGLVVFRVRTTRKERKRVADGLERNRRAAQAERDRLLERDRQARKEAKRVEQEGVRQTRIADASGRPVDRRPYTPPPVPRSTSGGNRSRSTGSSRGLTDDQIMTGYVASTYIYDETPSRGSYSSGSDYSSGSSGSSYSSSSDSSSSSSSSSDSGSSGGGGGFD